MARSPSILAAASCCALLILCVISPAFAATLTFTNTMNPNGHLGNHTRASFNTALQGAKLSWVVGTSGGTYWTGGNDIVTITFQTSSSNCQNVTFQPAAGDGQISGTGAGRTLTITFPASTIGSSFGEGACVISSIAMSASYDNAAATDSGTLPITGGTSTVYEAAPTVSSITPASLISQTSGSFLIDGTHLPFAAEFPDGASVELIITGTGCGSMAAVATTPVTNPTSTSISIPFTVTAPVAGCSVVLNKLQRSSFVATITPSPATVATYQDAAPVDAPAVAAPVDAPIVAVPVDAPAVAAPLDSQQVPIAAPDSAAPDATSNAPTADAAPQDPGSDSPVQAPVSTESAPANAPAEIFTRKLEMRLDVESTNLNAAAVDAVKQVLIKFFELESWGPSVITILNINGATLPVPTRKRALTPFTAVFAGDAALVAKIDAKMFAWTDASRAALGSDLAKAAGATSGEIVFAGSTPASTPEALPAGTIVGIIIACALGIVVAVVIVYVLMQGRRAEQKSSSRSRQAKADDPVELSSPKEVRASKRVGDSTSSSEEQAPLTQKKTNKTASSSDSDDSDGKSDQSNNSDSDSSEKEAMIHKKVEKHHESSGSDEDEDDSDDEESSEPISLAKKLEAKANKKDEPSSSGDDEDSSSASSAYEKKRAVVESSEASSLDSSSEAQVKKLADKKQQSSSSSSSSDEDNSSDFESS